MNICGDFEYDGFYFMKINKLILKNYRNYKNLDLEFSPNQNIIIGNNAQGKTNILEAIYYLAITKSFLCNNEKNVINNESNSCSISGNIVTNEFNKKLSITLGDNDKILKINRKKITRHYEYLGFFKVVIFTPDNVRLLKDSPSNRRKFFNIELCQLYSKYLNVLNDYNALLKQRNEYLKVIKNNNKRNDIYLDVLNNKFVEDMLVITKYRSNFIDMLNKYVDDIYYSISGDCGLKLIYLPVVESFDKDSSFDDTINKINSIIDKEINYGISLYGPHKDDFSFYLNDIDLSAYGSQGQIKMAILSLRIAELFVFKDICGESPVLLLDDIFSELDIYKRNKLINYLNFDVQSIITTTDLNDIDESFVKKARIFTVSGGNVTLSNLEGEVRK